MSSVLWIKILLIKKNFWISFFSHQLSPKFISWTFVTHFLRLVKIDFAGFLSSVFFSWPEDPLLSVFIIFVFLSASSSHFFYFSFFGTFLSPPKNLLVCFLNDCLYKRILSSSYVRIVFLLCFFFLGNLFFSIFLLFSFLFLFLLSVSLFLNATPPNFPLLRGFTRFSAHFHFYSLLDFPLLLTAKKTI